MCSDTVIDKSAFACIEKVPNVNERACPVTETFAFATIASFPIDDVKDNPVEFIAE